MGPRGKFHQPQGQVGQPEPILAPNPINSKMAKKDPRTQIDQEPHFGHFQPMASGNHQRPPAQSQQGFPSAQGKTSPSLMCPVPKDPGVLHVWYNIPLCTIFAQQSNGDVFRRKLFLFNSSPQSHHPFQRKSFSVIQSCNPWQLPEDHSGTPTTWPYSSLVVFS
ncbi:hypothetical protein O181_012271 [Austropuccinia psidii MF-1]|uniref:Uncharacterized protein n=1 Tax=Austropuccinia psidii MF-1 TaxID=1389203 RepID=A0A9Q3GM53_9BASI|nr:hypothetical protein [Austropuccinia psidii MF-1]